MTIAKGLRESHHAVEVTSFPVSVIFSPSVFCEWQPEGRFMSIAVECEICGKQYKLNDTLAGKKVNCKACGSAMMVPGGEDDDDVMEVDDRPARRKGAGGKKAGRGKKKSSGAGLMIGLLLGGGLAVVLVGGVVIFVVMRMMSGGNPQAAQNPPAPTTPAGSSTPGTPVAAAPTIPAMNTGSSTPAANPANTANTRPATTSTESKLIVEAQPPINWTATADPPQTPLPSEWASDFTLPITARRVDKDNFTYPVIPSPYVIIGNNNDQKAQRDLWNLATAKKEGKLDGIAFHSSYQLALSPDGHYMAFGGSGQAISVYDVPKNKLATTILVNGSEFNLATMAIVPGDRLIALSQVHDKLRAWQLPQGEQLYDVDLGKQFGYADKSAYSPGGKYLAIESEFLKGWIRLYDLTTGSQVGELHVEQNRNAGYIQFFQLAFSADGSQLAGLWDASGSNSKSQIVIWNMSDGKLAENIIVTPGIKEHYDPDSQAVGLQWFPDGRKFLVHGLAVVDRAKQQTVYTFEKTEIHSPTIRRPLSPELLAAFDGNHEKATLKALPLSDAELARAENLAAVGGLPEDMKLPPLTKTDYTSITATRPSSSWSGQPDPAPAMAADVLTKPLPLVSGAGTVRDVLLTGGATPRAFARVAEGENLKDAKLSYADTRFRAGPNGVETIVLTRPIVAEKNRIEVVDLVERKAGTPIEIPFSADLVGATPDAVLVKAHNAKGRLDVFDAAGQHVAGFRPYKGVADEDDLELRAAALVDPTHVVTTNLSRQLVGWELPTCQPKFTVNDVGVFAVSPGGRDVACATPEGIDLRDARTGASHGVVGIRGSILAIAFHPQGEQLAIMLSEKGGNYLYMADLKTGAVGAEIPSPVAGEKMHWCGDKHLLIYSEVLRTPPANALSMALLDVDAKTVAWTYKLPAGVMAAKMVDGRTWYAAPKSERVPALQLVAVALPEAKVAQALTANKLEPELLVQPGGQVSMTMNVPSIPWQSNLSQTMQDTLKQAVEKSGVSIGTGAGIRVEIVAKPGSGKTFQVSKLGDRTNVTTVQENSIELTIRYLRGQEVLHLRDFRSSNNLGFGLKHLKPNQSVQQAFDDDLSQKITQFCDSLVLPSYVFSRRSATGLGSTTLNGDGPVTGPVSKKNDPVALSDGHHARN